MKRTKRRKAVSEYIKDEGKTNLLAALNLPEEHLVKAAQAAARITRRKAKTVYKWCAHSIQKMTEEDRA